MIKRITWLAILVLAGCADDPLAPAPETPTPLQLRPSFGLAQGKTGFLAACAPCHSSGNGFDLAVFSYADSTIIRRALGHVLPPVAADILTYIRSIQSPKLPENVLVGQPGNTVLPGGMTQAGDITFARTLFGGDWWPATITRAALLAINPLKVRVALPLLPWSDETSSLEWMPADPIPPAILSFNNGAAAKAIAAYQLNPTLANIHSVLSTVDLATTSPSNSIQPCRVNSAAKVNYRQCFEIRRWVASLSVMYMIKNGITGFLSTPVHLQWWDVGDIARRAYGKKAIPDQPHHQARWMYLGWMYDPANEPSIYTTEGLARVRLPRHAVFVALRSLVARRPNAFAEDESPFTDFQELAEVAPKGTAWSYNAARFALTELLRRVNAGQRPQTAVLKAMAKYSVTGGMLQLVKKVTPAQWASLNKMANTVRLKIGT